MINCLHCNFAHEVFQPRCASCGAPLQPASSAATPVVMDDEPVLEKIKRVCRQTIVMYRVDSFVNGDSIPEKKIRTVMKSFTVFPNGKEIYLYCDTSPLNNGKLGFMICEDGTYWQNNWFTATNRNFLPWAKLKERDNIVLRKYDLDLGSGDVISMSGLGRKPLMSVVEGVFQRIQKILNNKSI